jgi:hypothetical protein
MLGQQAPDEPHTKKPRLIESAQGAHRRSGDDVGHDETDLANAKDVGFHGKSGVDERTHG